MFANLNQWFTKLTDHPDGGRLLLRLTFAILMLFHGVAKVQHGVGWIADMLNAAHIPSFIAYGTYIGEIVAPILIILGIFTRPAAFIMGITVLVAVLMLETGNLFQLSPVGAWMVENQALYVLGCLSIMLLGSGKYSVIANKAYR